MASAALALCTHEDVISRMGGDEYVTQLLDKDADGNYDRARMDVAIGDASEAVASAAKVTIDLRAAVVANNVPPAAKILTAQLTIGLLWDYNTGGQACPVRTQAMIADARARLEKVRLRQESLGDPESYPASSQVLGAVNADPYGRRMSVGNFSRRGGFR